MPPTRAVYLRRGGKAHLVTTTRAGELLSEHVACLRCGSKPRAWERWYGLWTPVEQDRVAKLPPCQETVKK